MFDMGRMSSMHCSHAQFTSELMLIARVLCFWPIRHRQYRFYGSITHTVLVHWLSVAGSKAYVTNLLSNRHTLSLTKFQWEIFCISLDWNAYFEILFTKRITFCSIEIKNICRSSTSHWALSLTLARARALDRHITVLAQSETIPFLIN